jgi:hypothetical protein
VKSITLPNDRNVEVLAIDVTPDTPRQQVNASTSFLDLSQVYGSTGAVANALRTHSGGLLKTSPGGLLPYDNTTYFTPAQIAALNMANDAQQVAESNLFTAGDVRANENIELTAMQTLFVRNHNRLATDLAKLNPADFGFTSWTDENLYQEARKLNIATEEMITYNEFLPAILGPNALPAYTGYNPNVNAGIATEFSTVAFRFGHSLLSNGVGRNNNDGTAITDVNPIGSTVNLAEDFFRPDLITSNGTVAPLVDRNGNPDPHTSSNVGAILKADADNTANEMDLQAIDEVRSLLFGIPNAPGTDLIARDIQRARDDGIGTYNQVRVAFNLPAVTSFSQISSDPAVQAAFRATHGTLPNGQDNVNAVDPLEGMFAEDHVAGGDVGPTIQAILAKQFAALRDGDRFFYLNESFNSDEQNLLAQGNTLAKVIEANTSITNLQSNVFYFKESITGTVFDDDDPANPLDPANVGLAGVTVNLNDDTGAVVASTTTDSNGHYSFTDQTGIPGTGNFTVSVVLPAGFTNVTATSIPIALSRGGLDFDNVNFGIEETSTGAAIVTSNSGGGTSTGSAVAPGNGSGTAALVAGSSGAIGGQALSPSSAPAGTSGDSALIGFFQQGEPTLTGSGTISTVPAVTPGTSPSLRQAFIDGSTGFGSQSADSLSGAAWDAQDLAALPSTGSFLGSP